MIEPEESPPICQWCNQYVADECDVCAECDAALQTAAAEAEYNREQMRQNYEAEFFSNHMGR